MSADLSNTRPSVPPRWLHAAGLTLVCGLVGYLDAMAVPGWSLRWLYLPVIVLAAWRVNLPVALVLALIAALSFLLRGGSIPSETGEPAVLWEALVRFAVLATVAVLASRLAGALERQRQLASTDLLTGLQNRTAFLEQAEAELNRCRHTGLPLTLAYLDCDRFKEINDSLGHPVGDEVLKSLGDVLRTNRRNGDLAARLGGDEFGLLLPETTGDEARLVIESLRNCFHNTMRSRHWPLTLSVGVVTFLQPPTSVSQMIHAVDEAMYSVKRTSKDAVHYATIDG